MWTDEEKLEAEADRLLNAAGAFNSDLGVYREEHLQRKSSFDRRVIQIAQSVAQGADIEFIESVLFAGMERPRISAIEVIESAALTDKQRTAARLMHRYRKQAVVAEIMGIGKPAVSKLLFRAFMQVRSGFPELQEREPSAQFWGLWFEELRYKKSLIYRAPSHDSQKYKKYFPKKMET